MENARALKKRRCWVCAAGIRSGIRQTSRGFSTRPSFGLAKLIQIVRNTEDEGGAGEPACLPFALSSLLPPSSPCPIGLLLPISLVWFSLLSKSDRVRRGPKC